MSPEMGRVTVKLETDLRGFTSGLNKASKQVSGLGSDIGQTGDRADTSAKQATGAFGRISRAIRGVRSDASKGADFQTRADGSQLRGLTSQIKGVRTDASRGARFTVRADEAGVAGVRSSLGSLRETASRGARFTVRSDSAGVSGVRGELTDLRNNASRGAAFEVRASERGVRGVRGALSSLRDNASRGASFTLRAGQSGIRGVRGALSGLREDARRGAAFNVRADESGISGVRSSMHSLSDAAERGATFRLHTDESGLSRVKGDIADVRGAASRGATFEVDTGGSRSQLEGVKSTMKDIATTASGVALGSGGGDLLGGIATSAETARMATGQFQSKLGVTEDQAKNLGETGKQVFRQGFGGSLEEVNAAVGTVSKSFGVLGDQDAARQLTKEAITLGGVLGTDVRETMASATSVTSNFGIEGGRAMDIMTVAAQKAGVRGDDLADTFREYSPIFSELGFNAKEMGGILVGAVKNGARNTDVAADSMKELSLRVAEGSDESSQALSALGMDAGETAKAIRQGGPAAKNATNEILTGLANVKDPQKRAKLEAQLFGDEYQNAGGAIVTAMSKGETSLGKVAGAAGKSATKANEGTTAFEKLGRTLSTMAGGGAADAASNLGNVATGAAAVSIAAPKAVGPLKGIGKAAKGTGSKMGGIMKAVGRLTGKGGLMAIVRIAPLVGTAFTIMTGPVGIAVAAVAAFAAAAFLIYKNWDKIGPWLSNLWEGIKAGAVAAWNGIKAALLAAWNATVAAAKTVWGGLKAYYAALWNGIKTGAQAVWGAIRAYFVGLWNGIRSVASSVWNGIKAVILASWNAVKSGASAVWNGVRAVLVGVWQGIRKAASGVWNGLKSLILGSWRAVREAAGSIWGGVRSALTGIWNGIKKAASAVWNSIKSVVLASWRAVRGAAGKLWNEVKAVIVGAWRAVRKAAGAVWNGVKSVVLASWRAVKGAAGRVWNGVKSVIVGSWRAVRKAASGVWNGLKSVIVASWNAVKSAASRVWNSIKGVVVGAARAVREGAAAAWNALGSATRRIFGGIRDFLTGLWRGLQRLVINAARQIRVRVIPLWNALGEGTRRIFAGIRNFLQRTWRDIQRFVIRTARELRARAVTAWNALGDRTRNVFNGIRDFLKGLWTGIKDRVVAIARGLGQAVADRWKGMRDTAKSVWNGIRDFLVGLWNNLRDKVVGIARNLGRRIADRWKGMRDTAFDLWTKIRDGVRDRVGAMRDRVVEIARNLGRKIADRWKGMRDTAFDLYAKIRDGVRDRVGKMRDRVVSIARDLGRKIADRWKGMRDTAFDLYAKIRDGVRDRVATMRDRVVEVAGDLGRKVADRWKEMRDTAGRIFKELGNNIIDMLEGGVNGAIRLINKLASAINFVAGTVGLDIRVGKIEEINIPRLAKGGITRGTSFAGEDGREGVVPLEGRPTRGGHEAMEAAAPKYGYTKDEKPRERNRGRVLDAPLTKTISGDRGGKYAGWDWVNDSTGTVRYGLQTRYGGQYREGIRRWNAAQNLINLTTKGYVDDDGKTGGEIEDTSNTRENPAGGLSTAWAFPDGTIQNSVPAMSRQTRKENQVTATHELGHTIGLGHGVPAPSIMNYASQYDVGGRPTRNDIAALKALWSPKEKGLWGRIKEGAGDLYEGGKEKVKKVTDVIRGAIRPPRNGRLPGAFGGSFKMAPNAYQLALDVKKKFGVNPSTYGGHGTTHMGSSGEAGTAVDFPVDNWRAGPIRNGRSTPTRSGKAKGEAIMDYVKANWDSYNVAYDIFNHKIDTGGGPKQYRGGGGYTYNPADPSSAHTNHQHTSVVASNIVGKIVRGAKGIWKRGKNWLSKATERFGKFKDMLPDFSSLKGMGKFGELARGAGGKLVSQATSWAKDKIWDWAKSAFGGGGSGKWTGDKNIEEWARKGLRLGSAWPVTEGNVNATAKQIMIESGGDPNAVNNWDINAARGTPSKGAIQVIEPTWRSIRSMYGQDIGSFDANWMNPIKSVAAGSRSMKSQWGRWVWPTTGGYNTGGVIPGPKGAPKEILAHSGERVLPQDLNKGFERLAHSIELWSARQGGGAVTPPSVSTDNRGVERRLESLEERLTEIADILEVAPEETGKRLRRGVERIADDAIIGASKGRRNR